MKHPENIRRARGFTLMEAMIVLAIIAILAALAMPLYSDYVTKARRSDAFDALLFVQAQQEKYRANNTTYSTLANIGYSGTTSVDGYYGITVVSTTATTYTVTAAARAGTSQVDDTHNPVNCTSLVLTITAANPRGTKTPTACWSR